MTKITKYTILIFLVALQVVYFIEIIERVILNKWSDIFFPCIFSLFFRTFAKKERNERKGHIFIVNHHASFILCRKQEV